MACALDRWRHDLRGRIRGLQSYHRCGVTDPVAADSHLIEGAGEPQVGTMYLEPIRRPRQAEQVHDPLFVAGVAHGGPHSMAPRQQLTDQMAADETGGAGD